MVACHGGEGTGKSTTAKNLARATSRLLGVPTITIFTIDQLLEVLAEGKTRRIYILDEAINIFHNQDWASWQAKALTKIVRQMRIMQCIWILNVPDFEGLHPYLRDFRVICRMYHPPYWDTDGLGNGPARLLFKQERFNYKEGSVQTRWHDAGDIHSRCMDDDPDWQSYEADKVANFRRLVKEMQQRIQTDQDKEQAAKVRRGKAKTKKATKKSEKAAEPGQAASPPTATQ